jgi:cytochrome P450
MPHSFLFGHLVVLAKVAIKYRHPRDAQAHWMFHFIQKAYPEVVKCGLVYMDTWPIGYPMIAVFEPGMMAQFTQEISQPKWWAQGHKEFRHYTGGEDLVHLEGREWKQARAMFNPGFSARNLLSMIPQFIEESLVFKERLRKAADTNEVIPLELWTTDLTLDIIGRAVL